MHDSYLFLKHTQLYRFFKPIIFVQGAMKTNRNYRTNKTNLVTPPPLVLKKREKKLPNEKLFWGARCSCVAFRARLGGGSPCPLVSPVVQEEERRRLWAPPGQVLGRHLKGAAGKRLAVSSRFTASSRRSAVSALGTAGQGARAALEGRYW